ncbi:hypothetical protein [Streptomyces sp. WM6372]|nr:hypothetical protein [Streptomyces sp. WM6372]
MGLIRVGGYAYVASSSRRRDSSGRRIPMAYTWSGSAESISAR